jgi:nicotinamidase-related amidase
MPHVNMIEADLAVLVVIDVQEKMLAAVTTSPREGLIQRLSALIRAAQILELPVIYTEQYPQGLGQTDRSLAGALEGAKGPIIKNTCSCWRDEAFRGALQGCEREHIILAGLEAHVCIQQTAMDLLRVDYVPFVAVDAIGSRRQTDFDAAVARMRRAGVEISSTEALLFELVERCDHPRFKEFIKLIK